MNKPLALALAFEDAPRIAPQSAQCIIQKEVNCIELPLIHTHWSDEGALYIHLSSAPPSYTVVITLFPNNVIRIIESGKRVRWAND